MDYVLKNSKITAIISDLGAEIISLKFNNMETLWQNQNGLWAGHAPILFPFSGHVETVINGVKYPYTIHGFSRKFVYNVDQANDQEICFTLNSSNETKVYYPYDFEFKVIYKLLDNSVETTYSLFNPSNGPIYSTFGAHESFMLNEDINNFHLEFDKTEDFYLYSHTLEGLLTGEKQKICTGKIFPITDKYLYESKTVIFGEIASRKVSVVRNDGKKYYELEFEGYPYLNVWRPGDAKMVCVEPWCNHPDFVSDGLKEFKEKDGVFEIKTNETLTLTRYTRYF